MIEVNAYTGAWQEALRPSAPRVGSLVRVPNPERDTPDGREWDDFRRCLRAAGRGLQFVRGNRRSDYYRVVREDRDA